MDPEPVDPRLVPPLRLLRHQCGIDLEQDVVEAGPEVRAIDAVVARRLRVVDVLAFGAVEFHLGVAGDVVLGHGEEMLRLADYARAFAEDALLVLVHL